MAVVILNPNSTETMTSAMVTAASHAVPHQQFEGWTSHRGPASIQGEADGHAAAPYVLELVEQAARDGAEAIIIGCFDDTALREAATLASCPVVGLGQASYHFAALRQWRFSVVTTLAASVPVLERNIRTQGLAQHLARVRASDVPVLELETNPAAAGQHVRAEAMRAEQDDGVSAIILGCAGMVQVVEEVRRALSIEVIDPVICAAECAAWLLRG